MNKKNNFESNSKIKIGINCHSLAAGGIARNTELLINSISKIKIFKIFLFIHKTNNTEYKISKDIKKIKIPYNPKILKKYLLRKKINIFIYQLYSMHMINMLKSLKNLKVIFYIHSCFLYWIYKPYYNIFRFNYNEYTHSDYVISIIPFENDYLFKKWGINSIYMNNFLSFNYDRIIQSDLSSKKILLIGRADDKNKRFEIGILSMKYIIKEISQCQLLIISKNNSDVENLIKSLKLEKNIKITGYTNIPEIYFKNSSLHIFPSISEAFPMVLSEAKLYGIPSILLGIDYVSAAKEGTIIIYDDKPEIIGKFAISILNNDEYRKKMGKAARRSMKRFNNKILIKKWVKLFLAINKGKKCFLEFRNNYKSINKNESINILNSQIKLLKKRLPKFQNININDILNFSFIKNLYISNNY